MKNIPRHFFKVMFKNIDVIKTLQKFILKVLAGLNLTNYPHLMRHMQWMLNQIIIFNYQMIPKIFLCR